MNAVRIRFQNVRIFIFREQKKLHRYDTINYSILIAAIRICEHTSYAQCAPLLEFTTTIKLYRLLDGRTRFELFFFLFFFQSEIVPVISIVGALLLIHSWSVQSSLSFELHTKSKIALNIFSSSSWTTKRIYFRIQLTWEEKKKTKQKSNREASSSRNA